MSIAEEFKSFLSKSPATNRNYFYSLQSKKFIDYATNAAGISDVFSVTDLGVIKSLYDGLYDNNNSLAMDANSVANHACRSALREYAEYLRKSGRATILIKADDCLAQVPNFDELACKLIAATAIFCDKIEAEMVRAGDLGSGYNIGKGNAYYSWENCTIRRARSKEKALNLKVNPQNPDIRLDKNNYANNAIRRAVCEGLKRKYGVSVEPNDFEGFEACHIWEDSCYDERYHTSVANLVLIPRCLAALTDHCTAVRDLLKYKAFNRFGFKPDNEPNPVEPAVYAKVVWKKFEECRFDGR